MIRQQRHLQLIQSCALGLFADYKQCIVAAEDVAWLFEHDYIVNPPAAGSLANRIYTSSRPAANYSLPEWNAHVGQLFQDLGCGCVHFWHFGGWTDG